MSMASVPPALPEIACASEDLEKTCAARVLIPAPRSPLRLTTRRCTVRGHRYM
jgi:hypothetical protein